MAKLTKAEITALLSKLGVAAVEIVDERADTDAAPDIEAIIGEVDTARQPVYVAKYGGDIAKDAVNKAIGKLTGSLKAKIKRESGLKDSDVDELQLEEIIEKAIAAVKTNGSTTAEEVRAQMKKLNEEWETKYTTGISAEQDKVKAIETKFSRAEIRKKIGAKVAKLPISRGDKELITDTLLERLESNYSLVENGDGLDLREKDNIEKPLLNGNSIITVDDKLKEVAEKLGVLDADTRNQGAGGAAGQQQQPGFINNSPFAATEAMKGFEAQIASM